MEYESVKRSDWDLDLRYGQEGEIIVNNFLTSPIETIEVKRDRRWKETGNLYIETECWSDALGCWYASGISSTKASHWSFVLEDLVLIVPTDNIRKALGIYGLKKEMNRPEYSTKGYLITVDNLLRITWGY
jgi:hypothetical protein